MNKWLISDQILKGKKEKAKGGKNWGGKEKGIKMDTEEERGWGMKFAKLGRIKQKELTSGRERSKGDDIMRQ